MQSASGCNGLSLVSDYLRNLPKKATLGLPSPTWVNYFSLFNEVVNLININMYDKKTNGLDVDSLSEGIKKLPKGSYVILQTCGNNPTGVDMCEKDWVRLSKQIKDEGKNAILDSAYMGLVSGSIFKDAYPIRMFAEDKHNFFAIQSFSKNLGLYGERLGMVHCVASDKTEALHQAQELS